MNVMFIWKGTLTLRTLDTAQLRAINGDVYRTMILEDLYPRMLALGIDIDNVWFQQDSARPHTANEIKEMLTLLFGHIISDNTVPRWPPRSPDLSGCDNFLWGAMKDWI
jgi:hypothetical protein